MGGNQTHSVRLEDSNGNEWTLRSIEKYPEGLIPEQLRNTFLKDIIKDNMSAQHPFSALVVPELAQAIGAPHSNPVIGWVAKDAGLGEYAKDFQETLCLLELREPIGKTDNTAKMLSKITQDNDITIAWQMYLKLKALDVLLGDWDRHEDQWRWKLQKSPQGMIYLPVRRDRDQVFYRSDGMIQRMAQSSWLLPMMQGYERDIQDINWFLWEGREINSRIFSQIDEKEWMSVVNDFCSAMTDERLISALEKLPEPGYSLHRKNLIDQLIKRRDALPDLMKQYYLFFNRIVDIELSDKNELIELNQATGNGLTVEVSKLNRSGKIGKQLYNRTFSPNLTKEVRVYLHSGMDSVKVNAISTKIKIRIIGGQGEKYYLMDEDATRVNTYDRRDNAIYRGAGVNRLNKHLSNDSTNTIYVAKDLYARHLIFPIKPYLIYFLPYHMIMLKQM
ncbi:hypothetical protein QWY86_14420 [Pedobacter aquatilis]|uniref:hypothetical protein n=1 Tax=Pedobacter aquatilis TaxID=351343 RepID=UPI0025B3DFBB|nr:hypothetical protein [Pedobacter aquatilis]MDN3587874.1 hypothetical protein [Pedobacter aquatilis]